MALYHEDSDDLEDAVGFEPESPPDGLDTTPASYGRAENLN